MNPTVQYIKDPNGKALYVVLPIEEYQRLCDAETWAEVPYERDEYDDVTLPNEVVNLMFEQDISAMAAWRLLRGLTQTQAAQRANITQSALAQMEKKGSKPQQKTRELFAQIYNCLPEQLVL